MAITADITEKELVLACLRQESKAQTQLYKKYSPVMFAICLRYSANPDNAKDMLQDAFIRVFDRLDKFRFEGSFEGWIKRVAVTTCLDFNKKLKSEPYSEEIENFTHLGSEAGVISQMGANDLIKLLQKLPAGYRTVFNLYAIEGYGHAEIAEMLEINENTSKTQLFKARKMLQNLLNLNEKPGE
jgi:RNA polymerase sigma factor (sigma-70 family)